MLAGCLGLLSACQKEVTEPEGGDGQVPVQLSGIGTRIGELNNAAPLYLRAVLDQTPGTTYITEQRVVCATGLEDDERELTFPGGTPYYPLGQLGLRFFAYTGTLSGNNMTLRAGNTVQNDYVLSNNGRPANESAIDPGEEGKGTFGSSLNPAELLQFRHVMTQLNVFVEVDQTEVPPVNEVPTKVEFTIAGLVTAGTYPITALAPDPSDLNNSTVATVTNAAQSRVHLGTNFLVPTGEELDGKKFTSLVIDDYTATAADLQQFTINLTNGATSKMMPGYAYDLTILVRRLGVVEVTLVQVPWDPTEITDTDISYFSKELVLDLGTQYRNTGEDEILKAVLYTDNGRIYVGETKTDQTGLRFVNLPVSGVDSVELYTTHGLLLATRTTTEYASNTLTLPLSAGGMFLADRTNTTNSRTNPYLVTTPVQFLNVEKEPAAHYRQEAVIDLGALANDNSFPGFPTFSGSYNGNGYWLANIFVDGSGLFNNNSGIIEYVRIHTGTINASGQSVAGGICGTNSGTIVACLNEAYIDNAIGTVGGICGSNTASGILLGNVNTGNIADGITVGGVCGTNANTSNAAVAACINTGMLNRQAATLGGIVGSSTDTGNTVVENCFWLVGTAQREIGGSELAVGSNNVGMIDTSDLEPSKLRNDLNEGEGPTDRILYRLNTQIAQNATWGTLYQYTLDDVVTGITWPMAIAR